MEPLRTFAKSATLALVFFLALSETDRVRPTSRAPSVAAAATAASAFAPDANRTLSPNGLAELQSLVSAANLPDLRWPDFSTCRKTVAEVYAVSDNQLIWIAGSRPTPQALAMIRALESAAREGLDAGDYDGPRWPARVAALDRTQSVAESALVRFDLALTVSSLRYAADLRFGRMQSWRFHSEFVLERERIGLARFVLDRLSRAPAIEPALHELEPLFPPYERTRAALERYEKLAREYGSEPLPVPRKTVEPGGVYAGVPQLARLLRLLGDLPAGATIPPGNVYSGALVAAVKHFQIRHGLDVDGRIGRQTFEELNTPLSRRVEQLRLALERWRWLPRSFARPPIVVNIPEFRLHAMDGDHRQAFSMKVVVGKAYGHQTPVFSTQIRGVIFRPYWEVPLSIQIKELVRDIRKHPGYLAKHDYEVVDERRRVVSEGAVNPQILQGLASGSLFARQRPGPKNSLGLMKLDMPNSYDVYMHGTPATALFSKTRRDFSHGCIRVEDPVALAAWVLRDVPGWNADRVLAAMNGESTFRVPIAKPIPVLIVYSTAVVADNGDVYFFRDIYHLDADLQSAIERRQP